MAQVGTDRPSEVAVWKPRQFAGCTRTMLSPTWGRLRGVFQGVFGMQVAVLKVSGCEANASVGGIPPTKYSLFFADVRLILDCSKFVYAEVFARLERNEEVNVRMMLVAPP